MEDELLANRCRVCRPFKIIQEAALVWSQHRDDERRDLEAPRTAIRFGLDSDPGNPAEDIYAELQAIIAVRVLPRDEAAWLCPGDAFNTVGE